MSQRQDGKMNRRDFTKISAAAGFGILAGNAFAGKTNVDTLKVGLLGCGGRGTGATINMLEGNENVLLVAMADLYQDRLDGARNRIKNHDNAAVAQKYAVEDDHCFVGLDAYWQLLNTDIDILIEGTPPYRRPKHIERAVLCGKHIFMEKPVAVDPEGIRTIIEAAERAKTLGLSIAAGTQRRHQHEYIDTVKRIQDGKIGQVLAMRCYWCSGLPWAHERKEGWSDLEHRTRNWLNFCWMSGDSIVEQHVHNLDVCNWVMGTHPIRVLAVGGRTWKPSEEKYGDNFDHFSCDFEYENGVHLMSMCRHWNGCTDRVSEAVVGTKRESNCVDMAQKREDAINPYVKEHVDLVKSIRGEGPYLNEGVQVAESTMTAIMGRMAAYTGQMQIWNKALTTDLGLVPDDLDFAHEYPLGPVPSPVKV